MQTIHPLSEELVAKIAAGEVIERPSFALKELIENAIDAKSTDIRIILEEGGLKKIQVIDNGMGMSKEDVLASWQPHTTSKLQSEDELHAIKTLGFRGEALSSLAAVSTITIQSKQQKASVGFRAVITDGKLVAGSPIGQAKGTIILAENLFAKMPARKKFLKSLQTELRHSLDVVNYFAVSYPTIHFSLIHGKRMLLDYPTTKDKKERIAELVGEETAPFFLPVKKQESYLTLTGFIAKPQLHATVQSKQFLFVNNRKVNDRLISQAVKESFGTMLESNTYPIFVLFLSLPVEMVDVNVHPRKEQVAFSNNQFIFQTIKQMVCEVLSENNITFQNLSWKRTGVGMTKSFAGNFLQEQVLEKEKMLISDETNYVQMGRVYIVVTGEKELFLVDQHAAHERILFEKLRQTFLQEKEKHTSVILQKPIMLHLTRSEKLTFSEYKKLLEHFGFRFSKTTITHMPLLFQDRDAKSLIKNILQDLTEEIAAQAVDTVSEEMLAFLACRAAVKAGDTLTHEQMEKIVKDLENTAHNATCPHGRPTKIALPMHELHRLFKRE